MKRSGGVTVAAIVVICAGVLVALYGLLAILGGAMMSSMSAPNFSEPPGFFSKEALTVLIAAWGIATGIGILRLRRWAWISMLLIAALLIGIAFTPVPRAMKLIRETTGIPTIGAPGFIGMAYAEMAVRMLVPLALGLWWLLVFLRKSVWEQFSGAAAARAGAAAGVPSILDAQGIQQQDAPEMGVNSPAGETTSLSAEPSGQGQMTRSGGVTAAAVVLFFGSGLLLLMMGLGSLALILPRPSNAEQNFPVASLIVGLLFYGLLAAWGIVTAVGILKLRPWARISILVMSGFAVVGTLFACLSILLVAPMMQQTPGMALGLAKVIEVIWGVVLAIPLGISIWWFVLFLLKSVRMQFATGGMPGNAVLAPPPIATPLAPDASGTGTFSAAIHSGPALTGPAQRKIPVSIIVIAIFLLVGASGMVFSLSYAFYMKVPFILFGILLTGWKSTVSQATMGIVQLVLGIALLRKKPWSLNPTIAYAVFLTLNALLSFVTPAREVYFSSFLHNFPVPQGMPPDFMAHFLHAFFPVILIFSVALNLVGLYFLWTRRVAYRAACAAASASEAPSRPAAPQ
ncbi:MAG TPA: hypothetical protein VGT03_06930 [Candidatus Acidoferrales bacterium]|nr:hypothetical protein [Candidatus Acidoferrales bacterium]